MPPALDLISADTYSDFWPGATGAQEVTNAKYAYKYFLDKLHPHQRALLVPGIFACSNTSWFPLAQQEAIMLKKLDGYFHWAQNDSRIAGFNGWHFRNRTQAQQAGACDMMLGAVAMPKVVAKLREIGESIVA